MLEGEGIPTGNETIIHLLCLIKSLNWERNLELGRSLRSEDWRMPHASSRSATEPSLTSSPVMAETEFPHQGRGSSCHHAALTAKSLLSVIIGVRNILSLLAIQRKVTQSQNSFGLLSQEYGSKNTATQSARVQVVCDLDHAAKAKRTPCTRHAIFPLFFSFSTFKPAFYVTPANN